MAKPQQPELARDRQGSQDQDGKDLRAAEDTSSRRGKEARAGVAPVPEENQPGHRPDDEQDKPDGPPA